jgi:hypothetical protein
LTAEAEHKYVPCEKLVPKKREREEDLDYTCLICFSTLTSQIKTLFLPERRWREFRSINRRKHQEDRSTSSYPIGKV